MQHVNSGYTVSSEGYNLSETCGNIVVYLNVNNVSVYICSIRCICDTLRAVGRHGADELLNKVVIFVHKKYSRSFV